MRSPTAHERASGLLDITFYHPVLEEVGERYNCWRVSKRETDRDFAFKIPVEIAGRLNELKADLDRVINFEKRP